MPLLLLCLSLISLIRIRVCHLFGHLICLFTLFICYLVLFSVEYLVILLSGLVETGEKGMAGADPDHCRDAVVGVTCTRITTPSITRTCILPPHASTRLACFPSPGWLQLPAGPVECLCSPLAQSHISRFALAMKLRHALLFSLPSSVLCFKL